MRLLKRIMKGEQGQVLPMALILLALGGLLVVPVLALTTTNLNATSIVQQNTLELYAADAGVENVLWHIRDDPGILPAQGQTLTLNLPDQTINGMSSVTTTITNLGNRTYRIDSIATSPDGHNTEIEVLLSCLNFSNLLEGAITSNGDVTIRNSTVNGNVYYADEAYITGSTLDPPQPIKETQTNWPTWDDLAPFYWDDVEGHNYAGPNPLYINQLPRPPTLGPTYVNGSLTIDNSGKDPLTLTLTGTIYVTGNLIFAQSKNYTLDLNGHTIFVHGTEGAEWAIDFPSNSVTIEGSGCIIANGNIRFMPGIASSPTDFVLVMSLTGTTYMKPGGNFYGSLVGSAEVEMQNGYLEWNDPGDNNLNFPYNWQTGDSGVTLTIFTYSIK